MEGKDISGEDIIALRRRIGYVIQNKELFRHEKRILPMCRSSVEKIKGKTMSWRADSIEMVGLDAAMLSRYPSGRAATEVGIARALAGDAKELC